MLQRILAIDDSKSMHALLQARLHHEPIELHFAGDGQMGLAMALRLQPDLILLDIDMPELDGFEVCRRLKSDARTMTIPIIFLAGDTTTEQKIKGLELGATDYVTKPFDAAELRARIRANLRTKYLMDLLSQRALLDGLTGLWNRVYFESRLASELVHIRSVQQPLSCLMVDLDLFRQLNERYGHHFGDQVLREMAHILLQTCPPADVVCRYGGEEFAVLALDTSAEQAIELAEQIRNTVQQHTWTHGELPVEVTCSIGVADLQRVPPPGVVELADEAMFEAKRAGRNRVVIAKRFDFAKGAA